MAQPSPLLPSISQYRYNEARVDEADRFARPFAELVVDSRLQSKSGQDFQLYEYHYNSGLKDRETLVQELTPLYRSAIATYADHERGLVQMFFDPAADANDKVGAFAIWIRYPDANSWWLPASNRPTENITDEDLSKLCHRIRKTLDDQSAKDPPVKDEQRIRKPGSTFSQNIY